MAVYVDALRPCTPSPRWRWTSSAHLLADTEPELHAFASKIGLRRAWFQRGSTPHYDLTAARRQAAVRAGAIEIDRKRTVEIIRAWRAAAAAERERMEQCAEKGCKTCNVFLKEPP